MKRYNRRHPKNFKHYKILYGEYAFEAGKEGYITELLFKEEDLAHLCTIAVEEFVGLPEVHWRLENLVSLLDRLVDRELVGTKANIASLSGKDPFLW